MRRDILSFATRLKQLPQTWLYQRIDLVIFLLFRYESHHVERDRRSGRVCAGLFGWIHAGGVGKLVDVGPGQFTGEKYVEILDEVLLPSVRMLQFPDTTEFYLLQDNSPIHKSRTVKASFPEHPEIKVLPHPPRSLDINPTEHIWAAMVKHANEIEVHHWPS